MRRPGLLLFLLYCIELSLFSLYASSITSQKPEQPPPLPPTINTKPYPSSSFLSDRSNALLANWMTHQEPGINQVVLPSSVIILNKYVNDIVKCRLYIILM